MAKPELGEKHTCVSCGARFFDLGKVPAVCPKCSTEQPVEQPKLKRSAPMPEDAKKPAKPQAGAEDDVDTDDVENAGDDDILSESDDIEDDDSIDTEIEVERDNDENER